MAVDTSQHPNKSQRGKLVIPPKLERKLKSKPNVKPESKPALKPESKLVKPESKLELKLEPNLEVKMACKDNKVNMVNMAVVITEAVITEVDIMAVVVTMAEVVITAVVVIAARLLLNKSLPGKRSTPLNKAKCKLVNRIRSKPAVKKKAIDETFTFDSCIPLICSSLYFSRLTVLTF